MAARWPPSYGTHWGTAPTKSSSRRRPNEHSSAHGDNWFIKPGMAHPPSTVWKLQHHQDHLLPSHQGGRDLPDGSATPPSSPLQRAPRNERENENIALENTSTHSSRTLPRGTSSTSPGSSTILSGRRRRLREEEIHCEGWKMQHQLLVL